VAKKLYFVAGEVSADNHGAALMRSLLEVSRTCRIQFIGRGGPQMRAIAGEQFKNWIGEAAVLGLWEVIRKYGYFREQFQQTLSEIEKSKPDALVLIDYPGFNLRLARALRDRLPQQKIIYYISPQVWAWNRGRVKKMARFLDLVLCIFPFEADIYNKAGLRAVFVGHPMIERLETHTIDTKRDPDLIGLFPGSRLREVRKIFPVLIETANLLHRRRPGLRFEIAAASAGLAAEMNKILEQRRKLSGHDRQMIQIKIDATAAIMQQAFVGIVASGSATLEAAYFRLPFVLIYRVAWPTYLAARLVVTVKYLGMPNVLANKEVVPEFIQHQAKPKGIVKAVKELMEKTKARARMVAEFDELVGKLGKGDASKRAARAIMDEIGTSR
jgi:lipid-A-disaccharide synthase